MWAWGWALVRAWAWAWASDPNTQHIADLVQIGFYLYLRTFKYTKFTFHHRIVQSWTLLEFLFFVGDHLLPEDARSITSSTPRRSSSPWTTRIISYEVKLSITSYWSPHQPIQSEQASTSFSASKHTDATPLPQSSTNLPIRGSTQSAPQTLSLSFGLRPAEWTGTDSDFPQKTLVHTISDLEETWLCTLWVSQIGPSWPSASGNC